MSGTSGSDDAEHWSPQGGDGENQLSAAECVHGYVRYEGGTEAHKALGNMYL